MYRRLRGCLGGAGYLGAEIEEGLRGVGRWLLWKCQRDGGLGGEREVLLMSGGWRSSGGCLESREDSVSGRALLSSLLVRVFSGERSWVRGSDGSVRERY